MLALTRRAGLLSLALSSTMLASGAFAQAGAVSADAPASAQAGQVEDILVTARKREERLQDVPLAIQVLSSDQMDRLGISDTQGIVRQTPSLVMDKGANPEASIITVRGLAPTRGRSNVAVLVDGIDVTTEAIGSPGGGALLSMRLLDVERVEVVRGPQSVQYGRSAFAGGIQYVTRDPSMDGLDVRGALEVGNYDRYAGRVSVSGPIVKDLLAIRVAGSGWSDGGFYKDQATLSPLGGGEGWGGSVSALLTPAPNLSFKGRAEFFRNKFNPQAQYLIRSNSGLLTPANSPVLAKAYAAGVVSAAATANWTGTVPDADELGYPKNSPDPLTGKAFAGSRQKVWRFSLVSDWDLGFGNLTSWTGHMRSDFDNRQDYDQDAILVGAIGHQIDTANRTMIQDSESETKQFSQELRFSSSLGGPVEFTAGGLYWREISRRDATTVTVACAATVPECARGAAGRVPFVNLFPDPASRDIRHWSAYGSVEWKIQETLIASAEGRYSWEKETVTGSNCGLPRNRFGVVCGDPFAASPAIPPVFGPSSLLSDGRTQASFYGVPVEIDTSNNFFTPRFTLEWRPQSSQSFYVSAAKGMKPGGTSTISAGSWMDSDLDGSTDELNYDSETVWTYELGAKLGWLNGAAYTNVALFYSRYSDKQVVSTQSTPSNYPIAVIENAGSARVWGLEFEGRWQTAIGLDLGLAYTFLDTRYTEFDIYTDTKGGILDAGSCDPVMLNKLVCGVSFTGNKLERAPKHALVGSYGYAGDFNLFGADKGLGWFLEGDTSYQSSRFIDHANNRRLKPFSITNLRFGLRGDRWDTVFYVDNLFDDDTIQGGNTKTGDVDRIGLGLSAASNALLVNLPDPRTFGVRISVRY